MPRPAAVSIALSLTLGACIPSIHAVYSDADLVFRSELLGVWENTDHGEIAVIGEGADSGSYLITYVQDGQATQLLGYLARIDGRLVLDVRSAE
ncbi:MAG TPA: hypothetical protein VGA22_05895 [Gemmatimonadales bacterium]|jgi:hypothetical protein